MKLVIFGATGAAGRPLIEQAVAAGHEVAAVARDPSRIGLRHERLRAVQGDVTDAASVASAIEGNEGVISAVGPSKGTPPGTLISGALRHILEGMRRHGVRRLVLTSGLMVGEARGAGIVQRLALRVFRRMNAALYRDKVLAEWLVRESDREWVIVRPPLFDLRAPRGAWRMGEDLDVKMGTMSAADVAGALLQAVDEERFLRKAVELSY